MKLLVVWKPASEYHFFSKFLDFQASFLIELFLFLVGWNHVPTMLNRLPRGSQLRATKATGKCDSRSCPGRAWAKGAGWSRICVEGKDMERQAKPKVFFFCWYVSQKTQVLAFILEKKLLIFRQAW